jgi:transcriptional regulator GlxA family with amidase domain
LKLVLICRLRQSWYFSCDRLTRRWRQKKSAKRLIAQAIVLLNQRLAETALRSGGPSSNGLAPWQVRRVSEYIDKHLGSPLPVAKLAPVVNLSTWYFVHVFKKHLGVMPATLTAKFTAISNGAVSTR